MESSIIGKKSKSPFRYNLYGIWSKNMLNFLIKLAPLLSVYATVDKSVTIVTIDKSNSNILHVLLTHWQEAMFALVYQWQWYINNHYHNILLFKTCLCFFKVFYLYAEQLLSILFTIVVIISASQQWGLHLILIGMKTAEKPNQLLNNTFPIMNVAWIRGATGRIICCLWQSVL